MPVPWWRMVPLVLVGCISGPEAFRTEIQGLDVLAEQAGRRQAEAACPPPVAMAPGLGNAFATRPLTRCEALQQCLQRVKQARGACQLALERPVSEGEPIDYREAARSCHRERVEAQRRCLWAGVL